MTRELNVLLGKDGMASLQVANPIHAELAILKSELEKLKVESVRNEKAGSSTILEQIRKLILLKSQQFNNWKSRLDELRRHNTDRNETTFTFELNGIYDLLIGLKKVHASEHFYCKGEGTELSRSN